MPLSVMAVGIGNDNPPSGGGTTTVTNTNVNTNVVAPVIDANARARAEAYAASLSASSASSKATGGASNSTATGGSSQANNNQTLTINEASGIQYSGKYEVRNVPNILLGNTYPTAPCMGSSTIGGSGVGFGFGIGTSWTDDECGIRETARSFTGLGLKEDAVSVLCTSKYAAAAPVCKKEQKPQE